MSRVRSIMVLALATGLPFGAEAQQAQTSDNVLQELIVTATKRETSLQDVPFSVAALSETQMRDSGSNNLVELARNINSLTVTDLGPGQSQVAIRGISSGQVVRDQPGVREQVGVYLDESPISIALFTPDLDLFDLERFEVLRGPQGTLFGAGSMSGTLRYITAQPQLGKFEGSAQAEMITGTDADWGGNIKGALNVPLGETVAMRVVGYYDQLVGYIDAVGPGGVVNEDVNGGDKVGGRIALLFQPNDNVSITPRLVYQNLDTDGYPRIDIYNILANPYTTTQPAITLGEREQYIQQEEGLDDEFFLTDLRMDFRFGDMTLTSITSYTDRTVEVVRDATQLTGSVTFDIGGTAAEVRISSPLIDTTDLQSFSQELRLASSGVGPLQWLVGGFYQQTDRDYGQNLPTPGYDAITLRLFNTDSAAQGAPPNTPFWSDLTYDFQQFALFAEGTYQFNEQWALTAGLRYYDYKEDRVLTFAGFFSTPTFEEPGKQDSNGYSPRAILAYTPTDDLLFSLQAARGFRLGGINDPLNVTLCQGTDVQTFGNQPTWGDETVWNYEFDAKTRLADGKVVFNTALFYSDIEDLQANTDAGSCSSRIVFNVPSARSYGVEMELYARPTENWDFGVGATWVDAKLTSTVSSSTGVPVDGLEDGNRMPTAAEFQAVAHVAYMWPFATNLNGKVIFTYQYMGTSFTQIADQVPSFASFNLRTYGGPLTQSTFTFNPELPSYDIGNLRFNVSGEKWEVSAYVNNIWDERAFLSLDRERGRGARVGYLTNPPRTYGLALYLNF